MTGLEPWLPVALVVGLAAMLLAATHAPDRSQRRSTALPPPSGGEGAMPVHEALAARRSCREFLDRPLSPARVGQLCWAGQGITDPLEGGRAAPSAGGLFPLVLLVVDADGVHEYLPDGHRLRLLQEGDVRPALQAASLNQACVGQAPVCLAIVADLGVTAARYGRLAQRYCLLEIGHASQNILLQAAAMDLAGVPVGAFDDGQVARVLGLPAHLHPYYLLPIGYPA
jgi:SagB-type dehydrogenase family enzyme